MITASRRQWILVQALYTVLFFLASLFYLIILTTTGTPPTTTAAGGDGYDNSWETNLDENLVIYYSTIFQDLISDGFLTFNSKTLTIGIHSPVYTAALKKTGVTYSKSVRRNVRLPFKNNTFDVQFSDHTGLAGFVNPWKFSLELSRTLKPGGYLIIHTESKDSYGLNYLLDLFDSFKLIRSQDIAVKHWAISRIHEIVLKKQIEILWRQRNLEGICSVPMYKKELIQNAEPLINEEPLKPWVSLKRNLKNFKYLPSMADISFKIFKIEAGKQLHQEYRYKKKITLLPYAAWVQNESLFFETN